MNVFHKITLEELKKNRTRTIVTVIGVILSSAMVTAVLSFAVSLQSYMVNGAIVKYGGWHVEFLDVEPSFIQERVRDEGVTGAAAFEHMGYALLDGGKNPDKPYLFIAGFGKDAFGGLPITLLSGRMPKNSGEVLVPSHLAANGGVKFPVGSDISLEIGSRMRDGKSLGQHDPYDSKPGALAGREVFIPETRKTYRVTGIYERPVFEEFTAPGYTLITAKDQEVPGGRNSLFVTLADPKKGKAYAKSAANGHAYLFNDDVLRFMGLSGDRIFNTLLYSVGGLLVALVMTGSIFLIYNSFHISLNQRTHQLGILSSVGATKKQLQRAVMFEGLCIGALGIPVGIITGLFSIRLVIFVVARRLENLFYHSAPLTLTVSVQAIVAAAIISIITILVSAYIPARKATGTPVMENIRQTNEIKIDPRAVKASKFTLHFWGLEGTLAQKNFRRNKKQYRSTVLSLTLSVALFVSAGAFGLNLKQAALQSVVESDYDICFSTEAMDEGEAFGLYDELKHADFVTQSSYQAILEYSFTVNSGVFSDGYRLFAGTAFTDEPVSLTLAIQFIEDEKYLQFLKGLGLPPEEYTGEFAKITAVAKYKEKDEKTGHNQLANLFADRFMTVSLVPEPGNNPAGGQALDGQNLGEPDTDTNGHQKTIDITFVDTIPLDTLPRQSSAPKSTVLMAVAPYTLKEQLETPGMHKELGFTFLSANPSLSAASMERMIQAAGITADYSLYNVYQMLEQNRNIMFVVDVFTYVFVTIITLIAVANVFNTISTNIRLRRRELAMLRSVGMSEHDLMKMMNFESMFYGLKTLLLGLPIAGILSWLIYWGFFAGGADIGFCFPWLSMVISVLGVFLVVFITMMYAMRKIKKENIIDGLRDDIV